MEYVPETNTIERSKSRNRDTVILLGISTILGWIVLALVTQPEPAPVTPEPKSAMVPESKEQVDQPSGDWSSPNSPGAATPDDSDDWVSLPGGGRVRSRQYLIDRGHIKSDTDLTNENKFNFAP
jgi:cytoskeletal protein RodZ